MRHHPRMQQRSLSFRREAEIACPTVLWGCCVLALFLGAAAPAADGFAMARQQGGPLDEKSFFPIAVWLQNPTNAARYREAGFNLYVGLWRGPTTEQLESLQRAGMPVICHQNEVGLAHLDDPIIVGWMHQDEPDNAQSRGEGRGYGPPIAPETIIERYERMRAADPNRPVLLNLGQGVAWDNWHGRGVRTNHPEDYAQYLKGCDIASFDIYPVTHRNSEVSGRLWYVAKGVERLIAWTRGERRVWNCIECTRIQNPTQKPTPQQVRCEVWMSIIHGSTGLIYFVHEWEPTFNESALLSDPPMLAAVTRINHRLGELAPVLNSPSVSGRVTVVTNDARAPVAVMTKEYEGAIYVFAVAMRDWAARAEFTIDGLTGSPSVIVLGEDRAIASRDGVFADDFKPWDVHLYEITAGAMP
jgi:hypothetical protein